MDQCKSIAAPWDQDVRNSKLISPKFSVVFAKTQKLDRFGASKGYGRTVRKVGKVIGLRDRPDPDLGG